MEGLKPSLTPEECLVSRVTVMLLYVLKSHSQGGSLSPCSPQPPAPLAVAMQWEPPKRTAPLLGPPHPHLAALPCHKPCSRSLISGKKAGKEGATCSLAEVAGANPCLDTQPYCIGCCQCGSVLELAWCHSFENIPRKMPPSP